MLNKDDDKSKQSKPYVQHNHKFAAFSEKIANSALSFIVKRDNYEADSSTLHRVLQFIS